MRGLGVLLILIVGVQAARPQDYPRWFLEQGALGSAGTAVGYSIRGFYTDSSASQASRNARQNMARQRRMVIEGGQAFWATEAGNAWMGSDFRFSIDSSALCEASMDTGATIVWLAPRFVIALVPGESCAVPDSMKEAVSMPAAEPEWVRRTPGTAAKFYSVGVSPKYYYETSSWESAERMAMVGLAKAGGDSVAAIEKNAAGSGQEILNEHISVELRNISVESRWYDSSGEVYYVLMSAARTDVRCRSAHAAGE